VWARRAGSGNSADGGALVTLRGGVPGWWWPSRRQHHQHVPPELKPDQTGNSSFCVLLMVFCMELSYCRDYVRFLYLLLILFCPSPGHCGFDGIGYIGSVCDVSDGLCTSGR
jgi:hypothetical protein